MRKFLLEGKQDFREIWTIKNFPLYGMLYEATNTNIHTFHFSFTWLPPHLSLLLKRTPLSPSSSLSCAILCVLKSLKLLLMASAYACIVQVLHDMKKEVATVTEERHRAATQLKATLECITPVADQRMSTKATMLARQFYMKVSMLVCRRANLTDHPQSD